MMVRALWAVIVGFLVGVFARSFFSVGLAVEWFALLLACAALFVGLFEDQKARRGVIVAIGLVAFSFGVAHMGGVMPVRNALLDTHLQSVITIEGTVVAEPDVRESSVRIHVDARQLIVGSTSAPIHTGILVVVPAHTDVAYGDTVRANGRLALPESFDVTDGRQFNYPMFLAKDGIVYTLSFAQMESTGGNQGGVLQAAAIRIKQAFLNGLQAALPEPEAGLAGGITVGDKRSLGKELTDAFKTVALIHVVVLSGYNITLVINTVRRMLQFLPRAIQYGGVASSVVLIVLMTGGAPSAVRAGIMSLIAVFARATGRTFIAVRILGVVALGMVAWNPMYLAFDPGFQLSILATLGLILFTEPLAKRCTRVPERFGLREIFASTIATQLTVLPLLLYQSGLLSLVALPANLLALIAVPYAMLASIIAAIGGIVAGPLSVVIAAPAYALLWYIIAVAKVFAAVPFAAIAVPAFSGWWMLGAYLLLFGGPWLSKNLQGKRDTCRR